MAANLRIHKEGRGVLLGLFLLLLFVCAFIYYAFMPHPRVMQGVVIISVVLFLFVLWFFRQPDRPLVPNDDFIIAPADGRIVAIEEVFEPEFFQDTRIQISIFMSPLNVHVNRYPVSGEVNYFCYHKGSYLVAWHPKSSELNERTSLVMTSNKGHQIMIRQIAGAVARRIVTYSSVGDVVKQGEDLGFIKFGSRVDVFLPKDEYEVTVFHNQKITGNQSVIARYKK
jgi:phosphatidylserine decarboxylase